MFKKIRSFIGNFFTEHNQMKFVRFISSFFWFFRKYFLGVDRVFDKDFEKIWSQIRHDSSIDKERSFNLFQLIRLHNKKFQNGSSNYLEFGVSRGSSLKMICNFFNNNSKIFGLDQFGEMSDSIEITEFDLHYGENTHFTKSSRFEKFNYLDLEKDLKLINPSNDVKLIRAVFPNLTSDQINLIDGIKFSFVYFDFDLYKPTLDAINFMKNRIQKGCIFLFDDYEFINQSGVRKAVQESWINLDNSITTSSGTLIVFNE